MTRLSAVKGFADLFAPESTQFTFLEQTALQIFGTYGYKELRTPILEYTELFARSIGTETDVVQKEMFTLADRKDRSLTMRPEATAGIMRSYIEHNRGAQEEVCKFFTYGPMFRYERPQKGRLRQFHQLNCECLGAEEPFADGEIIFMLMHFLQKIGLNDFELEVNTLGCRSCRPEYKESLTAFLKNLQVEELCADCKRRLETNPLRVLDCKVPSCQKLIIDAPQLIDSVCEACSAHFSVVLELLTRKNVRFTLNPRLVRGLDYYSRTTFEVVSKKIGAQGSVAGGGRYDGLVAGLGGADVPGIGFACGMERLALVLEEQKTEIKPDSIDFYIACLGNLTQAPSMIIAESLREIGLSGLVSFSKKSLKSQMRQASKNNARYCFLMGDAELEGGTAIIKNMATGEQITLAQNALHDWAKSIKNINKE